MKKILFSAVGGTDPISNFRDGALLHICRIYRPDTIYLYLSKEMCEFQKKDKRYTYCLNMLAKKLDWKYELHLIEREDVVDVHIFDYFIEEYRGILKEIYEKNTDAEILLNISSGTPAMKSALNTLGVLGEFPAIPIQVATPEKSINPHVEDRQNYDVESYWELNEDNDDQKFVDRTKTAANIHLLDEIKKEMLIKHIKAYDYVAAQTLAEELSVPLKEQAVDYLQAAVSRMKLHVKESNEILRKYEVDFIPVRNKTYKDVFEYLLNLEIKIKKEEYADFLRAITPIVLELFKIALEQCLNINWKSFCSTKNGVPKWDMSKLEKNQDIKNSLMRAYRYEFKGGNIYSDHIKTLICDLSDNIELKNLTRKIRDVEEKVRNISAHEMISVTEPWVKSMSGYTPKEIFELLREYTDLLMRDIAEKDWDSYDKMNARIIEQIK